MLGLGFWASLLYPGGEAQADSHEAMCAAVREGIELNSGLITMIDERAMNLIHGECHLEPSRCAEYLEGIQSLLAMLDGAFEAMVSAGFGAQEDSTPFVNEECGAEAGTVNLAVQREMLWKMKALGWMVELHLQRLDADGG